MTNWIIQEWPHSRALGERWIAFPPTTPPDQPWPGLRFFDTEDDARAYAGGMK
jgi:hypothetical protein